ncbi:MAG: hypothetical protein JNK36_08845 [Bacteroidia bacterium]|nr:hypothetical protein [Bacteroidia bacterium]MBP7714716.1 hypothetical protein [Bacteroidia bacterium]MBP8668225.1 hypothetical protein [Bacteroidia bacterium]HOZ82487.1 AsmA-like C-terminal region-containing protein [Bacteroidia bacterium]HOZ89990.1 AsmA-like C-terminal region-containing protein [Bacteroidia bacterium]
MNKYLRYFVFLLLTCLALLLIAMGLSVLLQDKIKQSVIEEINKSLNTPASVSEIDFSVLRFFPNASLTLKNVVIKGNPWQDTKRPLLKAGKIDLVLSITSIFSSTIQLKKIEISDAELNILTNENGQKNDQIFKQGNDNNSFAAEFKKVILKNVNLSIENKPSNFILQTHLNKSLASGNFKDKTFELKTETDLFAEIIQHENISYIKQKPIQLNGVVSVDLRNDIYAFNDLKIQLANLNINAKGKIEKRNETFLDLKFTATKANASELLSILPSNWVAPQILNYRYHGNINFDTHINGVASSKQSPTIEINFGTNKTDIIPDNENYALKNVALKGFYSNRKSGKNISVLSLKNISARIEGKPIIGEVYLENLKNPYFNIQLDADISLASLSRYLPADFTEEQQGSVSLHGRISGQADKKDTYRSNGTLTLNNLKFKLKKRNIAVNSISGKINFNNADVKVESLKILAGQSDVVINANILNFYNYIFRDNQTITINGIVESHFLDAGELLAGNQSTDTSDFDLPAYLNLNASLSADVVKFRKFNAKDLSGNISLQDKILTAKQLSFNAMEGHIALDGTINTNFKDEVHISSNAKIESINIERLFFETGSFGQQVLTEKNIRGTLTASVQLATYWTKQLEVKQSRTIASADLSINDGALIDFKPMLKLSRFVKGSDLQNVRFSKLQNTIRIHEQKILIPTMDIRSTAMNMTISGTHGFDNFVDYKIQMKLSQLLGKKVRQQNTEFGTIEDDGSGGLNLFLTMKGPLDNPKFSYDRKGVEKKITESVKSGKDDFLKIIKEEISGKKPPKEETPKKQKELQIDYDE